MRLLKREKPWGRATMWWIGGAVLACGAGGVAFSQARQGAGHEQTTSENSAVQVTAPASEAAQEATFDAARAFALLQAQCNFGPRAVGTTEHDKCRDFLVEQLRPLVDEIKVQSWTQAVKSGPGAGRTYPMSNILGIIRGTPMGANAAGSKATADESKPDLMLCAHWDTRPVADMADDAADRRKPILGANDGASGVATLLEVARVLKAKRPEQTIVIALWDGEDLGEFFYGARYFARNSRSTTWSRWRPKQAILIDMIGDRDLQCQRETNSLRFAPELYAQVINAATDLGLSEHFNGPAMEVGDDHLPLNEAGIPAIDLIDFSYRPWHTLQDTPDKCSPESLKVIGDVLLRVARTTNRV